MNVVIGVYILFSIVSPVVAAISGNKINVENVLDTSKYEKKLEEGSNTVSKHLESNNSRTIKDIYLENLKNDIKSRLKQKGYEVEDLYISAKDDDEYTITKIEITFRKSSKSNVVNTIRINEVIIGETKQNTELSNQSGNLTGSQKDEVKKYLSDTYSVNENIISIK